MNQRTFSRGLNVPALWALCGLLVVMSAQLGLERVRAADPPANAAPIPFETHDGYFVSNKFEPDAAESFVVVRDQKAFDEVFGSGFVMNDKHHRLPAKAFESKMVVAAIKRGKAVWTYKVESVTAEAGVLTVRYSATSVPQPTAEFASPLILSVPKGDYSSVRFVDGEKLVKTIEVNDK